MLVLTRSTGERLIMGDEQSLTVDGQEITLTILDVRGNQVRIGIEAPRHIAVHREEIFNRIKKGTTEPATENAGDE